MPESERPAANPDILGLNKSPKTGRRVIKRRKTMADATTVVMDKTAGNVDICLRQPRRRRAPGNKAKPVGGKKIAKGTVRKARETFYMAIVDDDDNVIVDTDQIQGLKDAIRDFAAVVTNIEYDPDDDQEE